MPNYTVTFPHDAPAGYGGMHHFPSARDRKAFIERARERGAYPDGEQAPRKAQLVPTEGGYQTPLQAVLVRETKTQYLVRAAGQTWVRRFSKATMLHASATDRREFPNYRLVLEV